MAWDDGLLGRARDIAATDDSPLRVMAGPGTGKSFAMKRRVARLIEEGADPERILAVTFTRNAAASLVEDLHSLGVANCEDVVVGTLHAFCFSVLTREEVFEFLDRIPRPLVSFSKSGSLQFECGTMLDDLITAGDFGGKRACTARVRAFESAWARLQSEEPGWPVDPVDRSFNEVLLSWLRFHRGMLIGELVPETLRFLRNNPMSPILTAYDHVIVDEYQDLNRAEQDLIDLLARNGSLAIVGDVDQSIYSFRHANPEGIVDFERRHNNTHDETLDECRRCPTRVVSMADYLICQNHEDPGVCRLQPRTDNQDGEVHVVQWNDTTTENEGIAEYISHLIQERGYQPQEILVLTPRRLLGYELRDKLFQLNVTVHSFYHEEALESGAAQSAFALLSLLVDPDDRVALRWWLGNGHANSRSAEYGRLREHCENTGAGPKEALESIALGQLQIPRIPGITERYNELRIRLEVLRNAPLNELIDAILPESVKECGVLRDAALMFVEDCENSHELLDRIRTHVTHPEIPSDIDFARIMSLHKSKGLTSRAVIVTGCVDGMIPTIKRDITPAERMRALAEQRRLFYVAITRCTELLVMSSAVHMDRALAHRFGARLRPGRARIGTVYTSDFLAQLGPTAPQPISGLQWASNRYR